MSQELSRLVAFLYFHWKYRQSTDLCFSGCLLFSINLQSGSRCFFSTQPTTSKGYHASYFFFTFYWHTSTFPAIKNKLVIFQIGSFQIDNNVLGKKIDLFQESACRFLKRSCLNSQKEGINENKNCDLNDMLQYYLASWCYGNHAYKVLKN